MLGWQIFSAFLCLMTAVVLLDRYEKTFDGKYFFWYWVLSAGLAVIATAKYGPIAGAATGAAWGVLGAISQAVKTKKKKEKDRWTDSTRR